MAPPSATFVNDFSSASSLDGISSVKTFRSCFRWCEDVRVNLGLLCKIGSLFSSNNHYHGVDSQNGHNIGRSWFNAGDRVLLDRKSTAREEGCGVCSKLLLRHHLFSLFFLTVFRSRVLSVSPSFDSIISFSNPIELFWVRGNNKSRKRKHFIGGCTLHLLTHVTTVCRFMLFFASITWFGFEWVC